MLYRSLKKIGSCCIFYSILLRTCARVKILSKREIWIELEIDYAEGLAPKFWSFSYSISNLFCACRPVNSGTQNGLDFRSSFIWKKFTFEINVTIQNLSLKFVRLAQKWLWYFGRIPTWFHFLNIIEGVFRNQWKTLIKFLDQRIIDWIFWFFFCHFTSRKSSSHSKIISLHW